MSLELNSKGLYQSSGKEKQDCCFVLPSSTKREIRRFHIVVVQRRQTEKYHAKKRDARAKLLFCQTKPIGLLPFSLPSPSSLLSLLYPRDLREPVYRMLFIYLPVYLFVYIFIYLHVFMKKKVHLIWVSMLLSTIVLSEDTIFTSPAGDGTAILRGHPSHAKV